MLIKPSPAAIKRIRERLAAEVRALRGGNAARVITKLSPITRGWTGYYRGVVSSKVFASLDNYAWKLLLSGPSAATPPSRRDGSSAATSADSTSSGTTAGVRRP
ncbi:group II intron maturase-specific domain-containing protein [Nonomuraea rubra]|uniref:group II intron maturase-specific domain-containing protein n=1 Tax=Nonomuraea rubra TaxID=46180 RepID=UPI00340FC042